MSWSGRIWLVASGSIRRTIWDIYRPSSSLRLSAVSFAVKHWDDVAGVPYYRWAYVLTALYDVGVWWDPDALRRGSIVVDRWVVTVEYAVAWKTGAASGMFGEVLSQLAVLAMTVGSRLFCVYCHLRKTFLWCNKRSGFSFYFPFVLTFKHFC